MRQQFLRLLTRVNDGLLARAVQPRNLAGNLIKRAHELRCAAGLQRNDLARRKLRVRPRKCVKQRRALGVQPLQRLVRAAFQRALLRQAFPALQHGLHGFGKAHLLGAQRLVDQNRLVDHEDRVRREIVQQRIRLLI
ncbi:hypothetical protein SDC9_182623 [bioreactor metagenome]|uniref:Uncharacterized protein n=1 Tax=bioreactor metagenome TaxID=1076179 RepID=A0A645H823_9ZZZZ